jgi:hypothetical protein
VENKEEPEETDSVLSMERIHFPEDITEWVLPESSDVLEGSPLLCHVTRLSCGHNKLSEITICLLSECSIKNMLNF